jgi:hypothetical protein
MKRWLVIEIPVMCKTCLLLFFWDGVALLILFPVVRDITHCELSEEYPGILHLPTAHYV